MKRIASRHPKSPGVPVIWREAGYAALRADAADTFDDRVGEDLFDAESERAEIDNFVHGIHHGAD